MIIFLLTKSERMDDSLVTGRMLANESSEEPTIDASMDQVSQNISLPPRPSSPLPDMLPDHLRNLLHAWYEEHGISAVPPCATCYGLNQDPYHRADGIPARFLHKLGMEMLAKRYPAGVKNKTVLVVKRRGIPASIVKHWWSCPGQWSEGWYLWNGGESWEDTPSIRRIAAVQTDIKLQGSRLTDLVSSETQRSKSRFSVYL